MLYQEGPLAGIRSPSDLMARYAGAGKTLPAGTVMFCGTLGAKGGVRPGTRFEMEIEDKARGRSLRHAYAVDSLPVIA